jgi:hypothetical protein
MTNQKLSGTSAPDSRLRNRSRALVRHLGAFALLLGVNLILLFVVDWVLVKFDLLSPPFAYGTPGVGFGSTGIRTSAHHGIPRWPHSEALTITMVGDSHSELVFANPLDSHEFVLEAALRKAGLPVNMISAGRGRYSPLQEYLLFELQLKKSFAPQVLLMNFYSGNDFYDMLRPDDRPHFEREGNSIVMKQPHWITYVNPDERSWVERSRLLWGIDELSSRLGYPRVVSRLRMVSAAATQSNRPLSDTLNYLTQLSRSEEPRLDYPAAFAAQILNQALFFQHFPESTQDAGAFMRHLLQRVRAENPKTLLVLASIPSAALMNRIPHSIDGLWRDTLDRTGLDAQLVADLENRLVDELKSSASETGWLFVDLRECLRNSPDTGEYYSSEDLHISATASTMIGRCQAAALLANESFTKLAARFTTAQRAPRALAEASASQ